MQYISINMQGKLLFELQVLIRFQRSCLHLFSLPNRCFLCVNDLNVNKKRKQKLLVGFLSIFSFAYWLFKKSEAMIIASHKALKTNRDINIFYGDSILKQQRHFKYLGVVVDESLSWNNHVSYVASRVYPKLKLLSRISFFLSPEILLKIYKTTNLPI